MSQQLTGTNASSHETIDFYVDEKNYFLGAGDQLTAFVWGAKEDQLIIYVAGDGKIIVPSVGSFDLEHKNLNKNRSQTRIENEQKEHPDANNSNCRDVGIIDFLISCRRQDYNMCSVRADESEIENIATQTEQKRKEIVDLALSRQKLILN